METEFSIGDFLINRANRYDVKGKKYISTPMKFYFTELVVSGMCGAWIEWMCFVIAELLSVIVSVVFMKRVNAKKIMSMS